MTLNKYMFGLFLGLYFLNLPIPHNVERYVFSHQLENENKENDHLFSVILNGDRTSKELRQLVISLL